MYYKLNPEAFDNAMVGFDAEDDNIGETAEATFPNVQNRHSGEHETAIRETAKPPLDECTKPPSVIRTLDYHKITNTRLLTESNSGNAAKPKKTDTHSADLAALVADTERKACRQPDANRDNRIAARSGKGGADRTAGGAGGGGKRLGKV